MPKPRYPHKKPERSEKESAQFYKGQIRQLKKRIKVLERENSRLSKYLRNAISWLPEETEDQVPIPSLRTPDWTCKSCGHTKCSEVVLPQANGKKTIKHIKCLNCGDREKIVTEEKGDEQDLGTRRK